MATINSPKQRSIIGQQLLKFFTKHKMLVVFTDAKHTVITNYESLFQFLNIAADRAQGLIYSLAVCNYEDEERNCSCKRGRELTLEVTEQ